MENLTKIHGCFLGVMIGDALGAPVEMMTPEDILAQNDGQPITGFDHKIRRKPFKSENANKIERTAQEIEQTLGKRQRWAPGPLREKLVEQFSKLGLVKKPTQEFQMCITQMPEISHSSTTDDWQLTLTICKSLVRRKRFDLTDIALSHVESYEESTSGWGGTTQNSLKELQEYFNSKGAKGRSPWDAPVIVQGRGSGNGIAMKVMPLAWMHLLSGEINYDDLATHVADLGRMTHSDPRAWAAAYALACMLLEIHSSTPVFDDKTLALNNILKRLNSFERRYGSGGLKRFSSYLKVLLDEKLLYGPIEELREEVGTGCIAIESVVFAIALFLRNPYDFQKGVLEAVNSAGDADTTGSMVGGLIGSIVGPEGILMEWRQYSKEFDKAEQAAKELCTTLFSTESLSI